MEERCQNVSSKCKDSEMEQACHVAETRRFVCGWSVVGGCENGRFWCSSNYRGKPLETREGKDKIWALRMLSLLGGMDNRGSRVGTGRII